MIMYLLKVIGARSLRLIVSLILKLKSPPQKALPKAAICITLAKIVESDKSKKNKKARQIPIDVYLPKNTSKGKDTELPVVVNLHGSGFLLNTFGDDAPFCQLIADRVECVVLDVSYGKAPERPFPNADEDIDSILEWVLEKKEIEKKLGGIRIASNRVGITGFSSGGKLALTSCVRAKGKDRFNSIKAVVAFYPSTNLAESPYEKPKVKPAKGEAGAVMPPFMRQFLYSCYIPLNHSTPRSAPTISPLNASVESFPHSVTIITCEGDSLAREAQHLAAKIQKERGSNDTEKVQDETATNGVLLWDAKGQGHAWDKQCKEGSGAAQKRDYSYSLAIDRLNAVLH